MKTQSMWTNSSEQEYESSTIYGLKSWSAVRYEAQRNGSSEITKRNDAKMGFSQ